MCKKMQEVNLKQNCFLFRNSLTEPKIYFLAKGQVLVQCSITHQRKQTNQYFHPFFQGRTQRNLLIKKQGTFGDFSGKIDSLKGGYSVKGLSKHSLFYSLSKQDFELIDGDLRKRVMKSAEDTLVGILQTFQSYHKEKKRQTSLFLNEILPSEEQLKSVLEKKIKVELEKLDIIKEKSMNLNQKIIAKMN